MNGLQHVEILADSITRLSDQDGVSQMSSTFYYDETPLNVSVGASSVEQVVGTSSPSIWLTFNEDIVASSVSATDLLVSRGSVANVQVIDARNIRFNLSNYSSEGTLSISTTQGAFLSTDGSISKAFNAVFAIDANTIDYSGFFTERPVFGIGTFQSSSSGTFHSTVDDDNYRIDLVAGQSFGVS